MAFSYDEALTADRDKIRLRVGDTQADAGPRPDGRNFSNAELSFILTDEDSVVNAAIAHCFEILASEWTQHALTEREGEVSVDSREVAANYRKQASFYRQKPGGASEATNSGSLVTLTRVDEYTDD